MNRDQTHAQISHEVNALLAVRRDAPYGDDGSLLRRSWNTQVGRFFSIIRRVTWRQPANEVTNILQNNRNCLIVSRRFAFTARIVQTIPAMHPRVREWSSIQAHGEVVHEGDFAQPTPCVLVKITDFFFKSDATNFLSRTLDNNGDRALSGYVMYNVDGRQWDFHCDTGWYTELDPFIVMAM